jgi:hypothetical protein
LDFILALFVDLAEDALFRFLLSTPALLEKGALAGLLDCAQSAVEKFRITITILCGALRMIIANALSLAFLSFHRLRNILKRKGVLLVLHPLNSDYYR